MSDMSAGANKTFFGHPIGLSTLFFTEMWERFSYYGMRALLILFMTDAVAGGMGMGPERAGAIYGLYVFAVYALALPGGWIADRLIGQRKAVLYGGVFIAAGHYSMAIPNDVTFFVGLCLIAIGTGLLKPNVSAIVGDLYKDKGAKRDAGFSIFYMGINIGAMAGPILCPLVGEPGAGRPEWVNWHYGFGLAAIGMTLAIVQYVWGQKYLTGAGELKEQFAQSEKIAEARRSFGIGLVVVLLLSLGLVMLSRSGVIPLTLISFAQWTGVIVVILAFLYFAFTIIFVCRDRVERSRVGVCAFLFLGAAMFWSGFEQAGSTMNLFTKELTNRVVFGWEMPAGLLQAINPIFIIILAPVMGMVWVWLGRHNPSIPMKFAYGLILLGVGFLVMAWGSTQLGGDIEKIGIRWLVATYFFHTVGELCLSPVGLSSVTKLAPDRLVGQMMGTWFMGAALGNLVAGLVTRFIASLAYEQIFGIVAAIVIATGVLFVLVSPLIKKLTHGIN